jgi:hypothetical protein
MLFQQIFQLLAEKFAKNEMYQKWKANVHWAHGLKEIV